jgi:peptide subunit release factor 1 (eRF1)
MEENKYNYTCEKCNIKSNETTRWEKHINTELYKTGARKKVLIILKS